MITIKKYNPEDQSLWDNFISRSKNGLFLFYRDYMDYHSDRFSDYSLLFFKGKKLIALLPANIRKNVLFSHEGLTFGGIISTKKMRTEVMLEIFRALRVYLNENRINRLVYKVIPHIYHLQPAEEDLYALFINNARLIRRDIASTIKSDQKVSLSRSRKRNIKKARDSGLQVTQSLDFSRAMEIFAQRADEKYGVKIVHTTNEMELLARRFPENIKLFTAEKNNMIYAAVIIYESLNVAHAQYQAASSEGMELRASDLIFDFIISDYYQTKKYFDFGISTENEGRYLNERLIDYKERYGARAIVYDFYEMKI